VYAFIRAVRAQGNEDAKDQTQRFFVDLLEGDLLARFSPDRGSFRSYLKGAVRKFLLECHREAGALKRGGGRVFLPIEEGVDEEVAASPEEIFERAWVHSVLDLAMKDLGQEMTEAGKEVPFRVFERYYSTPVGESRISHADLAREFGLSESDVNHFIESGRHQLRERVVSRIREYVGEESEVAEEVARLFAR